MDQNNTNITITLHGYNRIIERVGCKRSDVPHYLDRVWNSGKRISDYEEHSKLRRYIVGAAGKQEDRSVRIKGNLIFLFNAVGDTFITCFTIPDAVMCKKKAAKKIQYRIKQEAVREWYEY